MINDLQDKKKLVRSRIMASIKSRGNQSTERRFRARLIAAGVSGWTMHCNCLPGRPDFAFISKKIAVFVDGCFWHGCGKCHREPKSNCDYWSAKIAGNKKRDRIQTGKLETMGWLVHRFWEHDLIKAPQKCLQVIANTIQRRRQAILKLKGKQRHSIEKINNKN